MKNGKRWRCTTVVPHICRGDSKFVLACFAGPFTLLHLDLFGPEAVELAVVVCKYERFHDLAFCPIHEKRKIFDLQFQALYACLIFS